MKKSITFLILILSLLFSVTIVAQQGINYKAVIKDANNAVVANTAVTVQFSVLQGVAQTNVYQETHTPTTDANGIIIINIGEGTVGSGVFADIDWASDTHFLNTQIDTGSGLTDMGTTAFNAVPYALSAKTAENVSGLEAIDEGNGLGLVKIDRVEANYGNVGDNAVDLSYSFQGSTTLGATGQYSITMGERTTASGESSTAMGILTDATAQASTAMGLFSRATGSRSTAMGFATRAESQNSTAVGYYNIGGGNPSNNVDTDPLLEVGNGTSAVRSNALTILKNGTITAPSFDIAEITDAKALVTKEYADASIANTASTGLETTDEGNGLGLVKIGRVEANYGNVGENAVDLSYSSVASSIVGATGQNSTAMGNITTASGFASTAMGTFTTASESGSTAMGNDTTASGSVSTAMGLQANASGDVSTAMGLQANASGFVSTAMGVLATASGDVSTAMGNFTTAESFAQTSLGTYNLPTTPNSTTGFNALDQLLVVGNGTSNANRSNALTILKNGTITAPSFDIAEITDAKALVTKEYADASIANAASTGLEAIDEGNGLGLVKIGRVEANYGNVGENAVDLSYSNSPMSNHGAIGLSSIAIGGNTRASGNFSTAMGSGARASGGGSTAMGGVTTASGDVSTAMGLFTTASGGASTAMGSYTTAESFNQTSLGTYNVPTTPISATVFDASDQLLVVGNGADAANRSNALTILKNGTITAPSFDISEITDAKALVTKEYADASIANAASTGLEATDEGNGLGLVKVGRVATNYGNIGNGAVDLSYSWINSANIGATGQNSTAMGRATTASGQASTASGVLAIASGRYSTAMGRSAIAESYAQTTLGIYNVPTTPNSAISFNALDQLFVVGNGEDISNRSNALTILKNGTITAPSFDIAEITDAKALVTKEYADASIANAASTGLEATDEGNGLGLVKVGRNAANYGNIGNGAVDLSSSGSASTTRGATGQFSTAMGSSTTASGYASTAMGQSTIAQGDWSTAIGESTTASGFFSTAMGWDTTANAYYSTAMGRHNVGGGNGFSDIATDPLLEVGNGADDANRSNALTILKNGTITAPSFDISEITDAKALVTKEYADANYSNTGVISTGLEAIDEGNGLGLVKVGRVEVNYGNVGDNAVDLSYSSSASTTRGATGQFSTAMGEGTTASGTYSTAMGITTTASGFASTAMGSNTRANAHSSMAIGRFNIGGGNTGTLVATDPLFEVGNGVDNTNRSNALTILKNGNVGIGEISPSTALEVTGVIKAIADNTPALIVSGSSNTGAGDNGIISSNPDYLGSDLFLRSNDAVLVYLDYDDNETGDFGIVNGVGTTVFNVNEAGTVTVNGSTVHSSDRRLKKEIETIPFGLKEILQLEPKAYHWKAKDQEHKSLGLIAQDVQKIMTNVVQVGDDELKTMGVSYTELIPVLIKATQEQQAIIETQVKKIKQLEAKNKAFASLEARLSALENNTATTSTSTSLKTKK